MENTKTKRLDGMEANETVSEIHYTGKLRNAEKLSNSGLRLYCYFN